MSGAFSTLQCTPEGVEVVQMSELGLVPLLGSLKEFKGTAHERIPVICTRSCTTSQLRISQKSSANNKDTGF